MNDKIADRFLVVLLFAVAILILFRAVLFDGQVFLFRDAAHFYYPLFQHTQLAWEHGLPAWNNQEQLGRPLLADPTSCAFYPGKLIFLLPIDFATAYVTLIVFHFTMAGIGVWVCARGMGCSALASGFGALSYAFGGYVLGQHSNIIYLFSAAWLPFGMHFAHRLNVTPSIRSGCLLSMVMAIMILGGDPQCVVHLVLIQMAMMFLQDRTQIRKWTSRISIGVVILVAAILLSSIQFIPSYEWSRMSERIKADEPSNVYRFALRKIKTEESASVQELLFAIPDEDSHRAKSYDFSIAPWRWLELIFPNVLGKQYPQHTRWANLIPAEGRVWTPTLYIGLLPFSLAVFSFFRRHKSSRWLRSTLVISVGGSLGWYGIGFLLNEIAHGFGISSKFWSPMGGIYWLMALFIPAYHEFRYPAKLWFVATICLSLLASLELDQFLKGSRKFTIRWGGIVSGTLLLLAAIVGLVIPFLPTQVLDSEGLFGPLQLRWGLTVTCFSLVHAAVVIFAAIGVLRFVHPNRQGGKLLLILVVDLVVANGWTVVSAPRRLWEAPSAFASAIRQDANQRGIDAYRIFRPFRLFGYPNAWDHTTSEFRQRDVLIWDRETLYPRYMLLEQLSSLQVSASFSDADFRSAMASIQDADKSIDRLRALGAYYIVDKTERLSQGRDLEIIFRREVMGEQISVARIINPMPRAWIVHEWCVASEDDTIAFVDMSAERLLREAILGKAGHDLPQSTKKQPPVSQVDFIDVSHPQEIRLTATMGDNGLVVVNDQFAPGWHCCVTNLQNGEQYETPVLKANGLVRAVFLPQGRFQLEFQYQPKSLVIGIWVSVFSFLLWTCLFIVAVKRHKPTER